MVKRCVNPECRNEFRQLNTGDLYSLERASADTRFVWLCSACAGKMAISVNGAGEVSVVQLCGATIRTPASHTARLRLFGGHRPIPMRSSDSDSLNFEAA